MDITVENAGTCDDTDLLWRALLQARDDEHLALVRAVENRMRELAVERRFAHLGDEELLQRIAAVAAGREGRRADYIAHSPPGGSGGGGNDDAPFITKLNNAIRENDRAGLNPTLGALRDEARRRGLA